MSEPTPKPTPQPAPTPEPPTAIGPDGDEVRTDNYPPSTCPPPAFSRTYAIAYRAALIQQKRAMQEHIRALGMQIAALENEFGLGEHSRNQPAV